MKIGIMTFWWSDDNYGQLLQCYALQKYLRDLGHDAYLIKYKPINETQFSFKRLLKVFNPVKVIRFLANKRRLKQSQKEQQNNLTRRFDDFRAKYIVQSQHIYSSYKELKKNPPAADVYIVGSDQVWNFERVGDGEYINAYCLQFTPIQSKRISYAASFGVDSLTDNVLNYIQPLLNSFSNVSVRENSGIKICNKIGINANIVCDPTLLLDKAQWTQLQEVGEIPKCKYVFLYLLTNTCCFSVRELKKWTDSNNLGLIYVSGNTAYCQTDFDDKNIEKSYLTITQWLYYLSNAEYVITNSFHCSLFSLIYSKKVGVVPLSSTLKRTNDRINSLFSNLNVRKTEIVDNDFSTLEKCQEQIINTTFIEKSKNLLESYLR
jgi:hypothetical protein